MRLRRRKAVKLEARLELTNDRLHGRAARLRLNGKDISAITQSVSFNVGINEVNRATIRLAPWPVAVELASAEVLAIFDDDPEEAVPPIALEAMELALAALEGPDSLDAVRSMRGRAIEALRDALDAPLSPQPTLAQAITEAARPLSMAELEVERGKRRLPQGPPWQRGVRP